MASNPDESTPLRSNGDGNGGEASSTRTGWQQLTDAFYHPFSSGALRRLPARGEGMRVKSKRADRIPDDGAQYYHAVDDPTIQLRVPHKKPTAVKVESKVWLANERTHNAYLSLGVMVSTIASGLLFGARDSMARWFAFAYALISAGILIYGLAIFQRRLTMISARDPGSFDHFWGPMLICVALFVAILANFIFRIIEAKQHNGVHPLSFSAAWQAASLQGSR
ncbi:putative vacuole fusion, non-autophagic-related protein [Naematelia encephala]|uniref:Putative vacuole fusion, non-autophagic-related protein n=1 Tax=Naematelia encephala TaxID=71784 RepID=A0A1Y2BL61_9TREE|nr:putative vacuole fusion, non-autophagic-related protein [Naematelia encephala]